MANSNLLLTDAIYVMHTFLKYTPLFSVIV